MSSRHTCGDATQRCCCRACPGLYNHERAGRSAAILTHHQGTCTMVTTAARPVGVMQVRRTCDGGDEISSRYGSSPATRSCARSTRLRICWGSACNARHRRSSRHSIGVSGCPVEWMLCPLSCTMLQACYESSLAQVLVVGTREQSLPGTPGENAQGLNRLPRLKRRWLASTEGVRRVRSKAWVLRSE